MAQPDAGAQKENKAKSTSFSRKVVLIKRDDECTSFSDMRGLPCKSNIVLSTGMTKDSVKSEILKIFPYLEEKRSSFRCAASKKVDNDRKEFDFGGSRIWDGKTIRAKINGNSNLYILEQQSREDRSSSDDDSPVLTSGISESDQESSEKAEDTRINPESGNLEGGYPFYIEFRELSDNVSSGRVEFFGVANVVAQRIMQSSTLTGIVPSRLLPGTVKVTATTVASDFLGETHFTYHAKTPPKELKQLLYNPNQLSSFFGSLSEQFGFPVENECSVGDSYSSVNVQDPASFLQMQKQQSVKILELLLYTAAEKDAQPFVEMLFSTSAGPIVFNYYKSRRPLPEDVAQANGNDELAQYLRDINTRLSKEKPCDTESSAVNWLELAKAVQQQAAIPSDLAQGQSRGLLRNPTENDDEDNSSNNFADSSSSASSDSEDKDLPVLKKFQEDFKRFIAIGVRLSDDEAFKRKNGFTVSEFLQTRRNCAESLRRIAGHLETFTGNTGIVEATGFLRRLLVLTILGWIAAVKGGVTGDLLALSIVVLRSIATVIGELTGVLLGLPLSVLGSGVVVMGGLTGFFLGLLLAVPWWIPAVKGGVTGLFRGVLLLIILVFFSFIALLSLLVAVKGGVTVVPLGLPFSVIWWIAAVIGGLIGFLFAQLFTVPWSIAAVKGGVTVAGPAGAATGFNAQPIKSNVIMKDSAEVKHFLGDLENKDTVVNQEVKTLKEKADSMRSAYDNKAVVDWLKDSSAGIYVGFQTHDIKVYGSSILEAQNAKRIASIVLTDIAIMQGVQSGMLGLTPLVGKTPFTAGETTAKMLSDSLAVAGIAFAVWDIKGVANIKGSDHAIAYRDAAEKIDKSTSQYQEIVEQIDEMFFGVTSPQAQ